MFEKSRDYISKLFKTAYHSILKNLRTFFPLFIAIFLIECILFTVFLSFQNNIAIRSEKIADEYAHHVVVSGLNEEEMLLLRNDERTVSRNDMCFDVVKTLKYDSNVYDPSYTVYIKILTGNKNYGIFGWFIDDSLEANYDAMLYRYRDVFETENSGPNEGPSIVLTPLYTEESRANQLKTGCVFSILFVSLASAAIFCSLYRVYLNDKKFAFGIYSTFGATRHELRTQAVAELLIATAFMLLPAYYVSSFVCLCFYHIGGSSFHFDLFALKNWILILLWTSIILYAAVLFSMRTFRKDEPTKLLSAEEGTNPVSSPKRSRDLLRGRFPFSYECLSVLRFRQHHLFLTLFSALLSVLFVLGSYFSAVHAESLAIKNRTDAHFTISVADASMLDSEFISLFKKVSGIKSIHTRPVSSSAEDYASFLQVNAENVSSKKDLLNDKEHASYYTGSACFYSGAFDVADYFSSTYKVSGAPELFSADAQNVLIGKTVENRDAFSFSVGDKITVAVAETDENGDVIYLDENAQKIANMTGESFWRAAYESFAFRYYTFQVVGIIEDYPSGVDGTPIVMHPEAYEKITHKTPVVNQIDIRMSENTTPSTLLEAEGALRALAARLGNCIVTSHESFFENRVVPMYCYPWLIRVVSVLFLLFLPLTWLYSQFLFFKKREKEFYILSAISAPLAKIRALYFSNLLTVLPIALLSFITSFLLSRFACFMFERYLPVVLDISDAVMSGTVLPFYYYLIGIAVTVLSSFASLWLPYARYKKRCMGEKAANELHSDN